MASKNILVVEDNEKQSKKICDIVTESEYLPIPAFTGREAFDMLKKYRRGFGILTPDLAGILLDINLPDMSGLEFLETLRRRENQSNFKRQLPVIVITAHGEQENQEIASHPYTGMACSFIQKPIVKRKLIDTIIQAIKMREAEIMRNVFRESTY